MGRTQNAWDPNLTGHVSPRTQIEKSWCHPCSIWMPPQCPWSLRGEGYITCEKSTKQAQTALINITTNKDII